MSITSEGDLSQPKRDRLWVLNAALYSLWCSFSSVLQELELLRKVPISFLQGVCHMMQQCLVLLIPLTWKKHLASQSSPEYVKTIRESKAGVKQNEMGPCTVDSKDASVMEYCLLSACIGLSVAQQ